MNSLREGKESVELELDELDELEGLVEGEGVIEGGVEGVEEVVLDVEVVIIFVYINLIKCVNNVKLCEVLCFQELIQYFYI